MSAQPPSSPYPHPPVPPMQPPAPPMQFAPQPAAPQRSWFARHKILTGLGVLVVLGAIVSTLGGGNSSTPTGTARTEGAAVATAPVQDPADAVTAAQEAASAVTGGDEATEATDPGITFPGMKSDDIVAGGGETVTSDDVQITTTVLTAGDATLGPTTCTSVTIVNNSKNPLDVGPFDFTLQTPTGAIIDATIIGTDNLLQSSTLIAGGTVSGDVCFDQDLTGGGQYVLLYEPMLSFFADRVAWVNTL